MSDMTGNRFATYLNRAYQEVARPADFVNQKAVIRRIAGTNVQEGRLVLAIGPKTKDSSVTVRVEYSLAPAARGVQQINLVLPGSLAEKAVSEGMRIGDTILFDGKVQGKIGENGMLERRPYCVASWFQNLSKPAAKIAGVEEI